MIARPDMLAIRSPAEIEVFQLTDEPTLPSCHVYMEAQVFTLDSRYYVLHRSVHAHGSEKTTHGTSISSAKSRQVNCHP